MDKEKLIEKIADTIYGFDIGDGDWVDFLPLAKKIVSMVERYDAKFCPPYPHFFVEGVCAHCGADAPAANKQKG